MWRGLFFSVFASVREMFFAVLETTKVSISILIIEITYIEIRLPIEVNVNVGNLFMGGGSLFGLFS